MTAPALVDTSLDIEASPETVWSILTSPERFGVWMDGQVEFEPRSGSPFRAQFPSIQTVISGEIVTLDMDGRHMGLTWGMESGPHADAFPAGCSLVEFHVHESDGGCRIQGVHSQFPSEELAQQHQGGWAYHLGRMALQANRSDLTTGLARSMAGWYSAWGEQDEGKRAELLRGCCADDIEFRDDWTVANGIESLSQHIGNCFMYMPGWALEPTGDIRICRGEALAGWRSVGPDDVTIEGFNHINADLDGTLHRVAGFQANPQA